MDILESSDDEADAAAAPAPTPTVAPPPTVPVVDAVEVEELPDVTDASGHDHADGNSSPADSATASSSPTGSAAAGSSSAHAAEPAAGDEWRTEGHALLQTRVAKYYGARRTPYTGTIVGWDPLGFEGVAPLFHVVHDDGDEEDLEEHEVEPAAQLYKREAAREAAKERKLSKAAAPPPKAGQASLTPEERQRREEEQAARAAERKQERDAARAEKARLAAEAKLDFGNHPMPFLKPVKELDAATANDAEAVAVWAAARRVIAAKVEALEHVHGWQVAYHLRGVQTCGVGDLIVIPPEEMEKHLARRRRRGDADAAGASADDGAPKLIGSNGDNVIRSTGALYPWLYLRARARAAGTAVWAPPAKGELVEFEGKVKEDDPLTWLQARVVRSGCGLGGLQVAATTDANFREPFSHEDEGTEWRRLADGGGAAAPPPTPLARPAPKPPTLRTPKPAAAPAAARAPQPKPTPQPPPAPPAPAASASCRRAGRCATG